MMHVYVDESGDPGLKVKEGSSKFFVIAFVIFEEPDVAEKTAQRIELLKTELEVNSRFEFKFNKCSKKFRVAFLRAVSSYNFFYYGICVNKAELYGNGFKFKGPFYKYATQLAFVNAKAHLDNAVVYIDGSGDRAFRQELEIYLKRRINQENRIHIQEIRIVNSTPNNLIQLADMVAGSVNRSLGTKSDALVYRKLINHREIFMQVWPQKIEKLKP